uniref:Uncharacterized protein n=1 Tax=Rhizophora mucronata TaxID=61149 RepID=A0A2P2JJC4_RHIMU
MKLHHHLENLTFLGKENVIFLLQEKIFLDSRSHQKSQIKSTENRIVG